MDPVMKYKAVTLEGIELVKKQLRIGFVGFICKWIFNVTNVLVLVTAIDYAIRGINDPRIFFLYLCIDDCALIGQQVSVWKLREHFAKIDLKKDFVLEGEKKDDTH
jgi:hypothetical protein